ncbi:hypothetical protein SAMN05518672_104120 [Chitinophaga sp. CF118]|uniref:hypothetical protein n=1 Tax=Chitinophaga sp. CF118 TaxID=1884367 RepID=UPI0008EC0E71|nr:hypothetical protein [Chitinophaga sp. CF118]SFE00704.1 hypothetical protein SAMN05518672_104120 [Chitinophaga sp. CF118]
MKKMKSVKFLKTSLQLLALQFPNVKIRYGLSGIIIKTIHLIELTLEDGSEPDENLYNAYMTINEVFNTRFINEYLFFKYEEPVVLEIEQLISEWNYGISESKRLYNKMVAEYFPGLKTDNSTEPVAEKELLAKQE